MRGDAPAAPLRPACCTALRFAAQRAARYSDPDSGKTVGRGGEGMSRLGAIGAPIKGLTSEVEFTSRTGKHIRCQRQLASANLIQTLIGKSMELRFAGALVCREGRQFKGERWPGLILSRGRAFDSKSNHSSECARG